MKAQALERYKTILRKAGCKATAGRVAVLAVFESTKKPLSPESLIYAVKTLNQATIYRILDVFKAVGLIRQVDFRHSHPHYELTPSTDHHHVICVSCSRSEEVTGCSATLLQKNVLRQTKHFKSIQEHSLEFYGVCKSCV